MNETGKYRAMTYPGYVHSITEAKKQSLLPDVLKQVPGEVMAKSSLERRVGICRVREQLEGSHGSRKEQVICPDYRRFPHPTGNY